MSHGAQAGTIHSVRAILALSLLLPAAQAQQVSYTRDVRPILSDACYACHGPDQAQRKADLRLDRPADAARVLAPGDAAASQLFQRVSHQVEAARMPPPAFPRKLTEEQIETLRRWIDQGAEWQTHWSYRAPERPVPPSVLDQDWARNPIDRFILARLEAEGLEPSPEADKATLLRRLSFDLTGLPPTPQELNAFLADDAPDAYERAVDRLLHSPRYGERMAMRWLDLARYSDTHGYHIDSHRDMWHWRDWVIDAYNRNLPYDRFTIEQLAGDLLPSPTSEQLIATGFNRNHMINFEGGAIPEEYQTEYVVDRVETTATVWMGMTMGCARCHDHKYDPIEQRDFYRFFAFFNTIDERGLDGREGNAEPVLRLPGPEYERRRHALQAELAGARERLPEHEATLDQLRWEETALETVPAPATDGLVARYSFDGDVGAGEVARGEVSFPKGKIGNQLSLDGEQHVVLDAAVALERPFTIAFWASTVARKGVTYLQQGPLEIALGKVTKVPGEYKTQGPVEIRWGAGAWRSAELITTRDFHHLAVAFDGEEVAVYVDGQALTLRAFTPNQARPANRPLEIGAKSSRYQAFEGAIDELRLYSRTLEATEASALAVHHPFRAILAEPDPDCDQQDRLREYYRNRFARSEYRQAHRDIRRLEAALKQLEREVPTTMVMSEMNEPRQSYMLARGDYRAKGEQVEPGVPAALPPLASGAEQNRLGLAKWLVSPQHPLTARVAVNRYWEMYFGQGLVRTTEDFGSQGEAPTHPELLDWLAVEFIESGWDVRAMQRLIVTSAAYRQGSRVSPRLAERDPENQLLARGPRFRLPAEMVRDNALYVSGLLREKIGGPSVNPYQPPGIWEDVSYGDRFTAQSYEQDHGEALYRRSMYTFWKRTAPPPSLTAFDAPDREKCTVRRARTNTPLQALTLLNDPTYVEASRALAARALHEAEPRDAARLGRVFELVLGRAPSAAERDVLLTLVGKQRQDYRADPRAASELLDVGESAADPGLDRAELAAWTLAASTVLNLDEAVTKE